MSIIKNVHLISVQSWTYLSDWSTFHLCGKTGENFPTKQMEQYDFLTNTTQRDKYVCTI